MNNSVTNKKKKLNEISKEPPKQINRSKVSDNLSSEVLRAILSQSVRIIPDGLSGFSENKTESESKIELAFNLISELKPKDTLEGLLISQMIGAHNLGMEFMKRAIYKDQTTDGVDLNLNRATKIMKTFTAQMEALNRYRTKGQQKIVVKHVHVHDGGQAIVGSISTGDHGGQVE